MPVPPDNRRRVVRLLIVLLTLASSTLVSTTATAQETTPVASPVVSANQLMPILPEWRDELIPVIESVSARYTIDAVIQLPVAGVSTPGITGALSIEYTNTTGASLSELPFRLYANSPDELNEALRVDHLTVDDATVAPALSEDGTTVFVPFDTPLAAGATVTIGMSFVSAVPVNEREHYGIFNIDPEHGTWALAHWYPILAGWDPDRGWVLDPPSANGDPIFSTTSTYDVTLHLPNGWRAVTTGIETERNDTSRRFVTGPVRDFTMVLDGDFDVVEQEVNGTTISSWYNPGQRRSAEAVLDYAAQSLSFFNELIGPYPYTTLDLAPADLFGAAGVEFPQLIYIGASYYNPDRSFDVPNGLDFTVAHEVLHQWWYAMVGNNQYDHAFIDEGLTNFMSSTLYFGAEYGPEIGDIMTDRYLERPFQSNIEAGNDQVVDTPTDDFPSSSGYVFAAYTKAPLGFKTIYDEIGPDAFSDAVTMYFYDNWFTVASPDDLLAAFEAASGEDLDALWSHWFEETAGEDDV